MNKLTILLTLWDRSEYTKTWFLNNYFHDVDYLIADGSVGDANELFFNKNKKDNINYVRFSVDQNIEDYHKKLWDASKMIKTPYVMTCDNDDFLNVYGLKKCVDFLEKNNDYGFCGGKILGVIGTNKDVILEHASYKLIFGLTVDNFTLDGVSGFDGVEKMMRPYRYIWYSVYRVNIFTKIWRDVYKTKLKNGKLAEMLQSQLSFCYGKYKDLNINTYIRLENPSTSYDRSISMKNETWHHSRIYFDESYRDDVKKMVSAISNHLGLSPERITEQYVKFYTYTLFDKYNLSIKTRINKKIMRFLTRVSPRMSMNILIRCINFFIK